MKPTLTQRLRCRVLRSHSTGVDPLYVLLPTAPCLVCGIPCLVTSIGDLPTTQHNGPLSPLPSFPTLPGR